MSLKMETPPTPFLPSDKEHEIVDAFQFSDKPLYIRSKGSEVHVGTKIIFEIQNENDIEKFQPLIKSLGQSSSDLSANNIITEIKGKQSVCNKSLITDDDNCIGSYIVNCLQNSDNSFGILSADSSTSLDKPMTSPNSVQNDSALLLTPDFFQSIDKPSENPNTTDSSSICDLKAETTTHCTLSSDFPVFSSKNEPLKLIMPMQSVQYNEYYSQLSPSMLHQQSNITSAQNQYPQNSQRYSTDYSGSSYSSQESLIHHPEDCSPNTPIANHPGYTVTPYVPYPLAQKSFSSPLGFPSCSSHRLDNLPRVKIIDGLLSERTKKESSNSYRKRLNKSYMEQRNFILSIVPGIFYDTPHGILVEMKNGSHYEIILANYNNEDCDVDLFVDMELVYRIRLEACSKSLPIDGPENRTKKFVFLRDFDAPPEAGIIKKHERNGQIKAVFKPKMIDQLEERRRAWSTDSGVSCSHFLNQTIGNITEPPTQGLLSSSLPYDNPKYRSANLCSGATALQSRQREKFFEFAEQMKVNENKIVVLQLRLVASLDDQSRPNTTEPITPLITKMPPPLPF